MDINFKRIYLTAVLGGLVMVIAGGSAAFGGELEDSGLELSVGVTNIYQQNVRGGLSKHRRAGRFAGSYDIELEGDMYKLLGIEGGRFYMHSEGKWSKSQGIDGPSVGSAFGVNGDAGARRSIDVTELWYEQGFYDDELLVRFGKIDLTGGFECKGCPVAFDGSMYANDETSQFLNSALVNNPTIPFPENGLAVAVLYNPLEWWYISGAVADAQADLRETGISTTFHDEDYFFYIFETGVTPEIQSANGALGGAYRFGMWIDGQNKEKFSNSKNYRDDTGFYTSCDQLVYKENADAADSQGMGIFGRYGWASSKVNEITNFWSAGVQYQGLLCGRDDDVIGLGVAQGIFTDQANANNGAGYSDDMETAFELYYNAVVTEWVSVSPSVQYISNPGGDENVSDAVVLGMRVQMTF